MGSKSFIARGTLSFVSLALLTVCLGTGCSDSRNTARGRFQNVSFPMGKLGPNEKGVHSYLTSAEQIDKNLDAGYVQWDFEANGNVTVKAVDKSAAGLTAVARGKWRYPVVDAGPANGMGNNPANGPGMNPPNTNPGFQTPVDNSRGGVPVENGFANAEPAVQVEVICNRFEMEKETGPNAQRIYEQAVADGIIVMKDYFPPTLAECSGRPLLVVRDGEDGQIRDRDDYKISPMESESYKILRGKLPAAGGNYEFVKQTKFAKSLVMASPLNAYVPAPAAQTYYVVPKWNIQRGMQLNDQLTWSRDEVAGVRASGRRVNPGAVAPVANELAEYRVMEPAGVKISTQDNLPGAPPQQVIPLTPQITRGATTYKVNMPAMAADERLVTLHLNYKMPDGSIVGHITQVKVDKLGQVTEDPKSQIIR